ncbi:MAG: aliphatic sulfonate ABC transporter substrate-binding protein [Clostridia bacterium]|nr:aliphatic sulfonate ABC transporter substrate-binding protein [Clostridia bacterium]
MKRLILLFVLLTGVFMLSSCTKSDDGITDVRIACFPNITHSQALVGMAQNSFQTALGEDCNVKWLTFNAGPSELLAMFGGEVDIGYIGPLPAINGFSKSAGDVRIIAGATGAGSLLLTRKGLVLSDVSELGGKKIAVPQFGNTQDILLRDILASAGLEDKNSGGTVEIIASENPDIKLLLDRGDIDAAFVPEPWGTRLEQEIGANVLLDYNQIYDGKYSSAVVIVTKSFLEKHPDKVEKFLREHIRLTDYINENPDLATVTIINQIEELTGNIFSEDIIKKSLTRMKPDCDPYKEALESFVGAYKALGYMSHPTDFSLLTDTTILDSILTE